MDIKELIKEKGIEIGSIVRTNIGCSEETEFYDLGIVYKIETFSSYGTNKPYNSDSIIYVEWLNEFGQVDSDNIANEMGTYIKHVEVVTYDKALKILKDSAAKSIEKGLAYSMR